MFRHSTNQAAASGSPTKETHVENVKDAACQDLLRQQPQCHGWLRRKPKLQQIGSTIEHKIGIQRTHSLVDKVSWQQRYVILINNLIYVFQTETATKAQKVLRVSDYRFSESEEVKSSNNPWPFILEPIAANDQLKLKPQYFCATTKEDLQKWKSGLQNAMSLHVASRRAIPTPGAASSRQLPPTPSEIGGGDDTYDTAIDVPTTNDVQTSTVDAAMWSGNADDARKALEENAEEGLFLLRKAVEGTGYTLMVISEGKPCKFRITENEETKQVRFMDRVNFDNLQELINHFSNNPLPNKHSKLSKPISHCLGNSTCEYVW